MKRSSLIFAALSLASLMVGVYSVDVIVTVPNYAVLNGTMEKSVPSNRTFYGFRGVFYAEEPTPETRFLPPIPRKPYPMNETQQAIFNNAGCNQAIFGSEDCLSLSIYTPYLPEIEDSEDKLLPVIVWIHGGSFRNGQALDYLPGRFMEEDVVLVVIQYRLGPLGFLSFDTDEVPGNAGIFDQIESLRWIQKHIKPFGGDAHLVTIAGESAGSASVSILLLAPQAQGLFHRAIGESGSVLAEWAINRDGRGKKASIRVAEIAECPLEPYSAMLNCVQNLDATKLTMAYGAYRKEDIKNGGMGFGASNPVMQVAGAQRILEIEPRLQFEIGNYSIVPIMFGANKQEGVLFLSGVWNGYLEPNDLYENPNFLENELVPYFLKALNVRDDTGVLADSLVDKYLVGADTKNFTSMIPGLTDMLGVLGLKTPGYETVRLHSLHHPDAYWYAFHYEGRHSLSMYLNFTNPSNYPPIPHGVNHADELIYLFIYPFLSKPPVDAETLFLDDREKRLSSRMIHVWTTFAKYGNPTPEETPPLDIPKILPYSRQNEYYVDIDCDWTVKVDYTKTYTVTVDDLKSGHVPCRCQGPDADICNDL